MSRMLDWGEATKALNENRGGRGGFRFAIQDGESVPIRFLIPEDGKPFIFKRHYVNNKGYHVCAEDAVADGKHSGCVFCHEARKEKKGPISLSQRVLAFSVFDPRKQHVFKEAVKGPSSDKPSRFHPCTDDPTCRFCRKGDEPKLNGLRHWTLSGKAAGQLRLFEQQVLGKNCAVCNGGKIKVTGYACPTCEEPMDIDDPNEEARCYECSKLAKKQGLKNSVVMVYPRELIKCSRGCEDPRRFSLADAWVVVTRSGNNQDTSYNFTTYQGDDPVEIPSDIKPIDFRSNRDFKPVPANEQAAAIGVRNPFGNRRNDEDDEDTKDDADAPYNTEDEGDEISTVFGNKRR